MNREEVLEQLAPVRNISARTIDHIPATRVQVTPEMVTLRPGRGSRILQLAPEGVKSMAQFAEMPQGLAQKLRPVTFAAVATELLERKSSYDVLIRDDQVVAFAKPHHHRNLNPERLLRTIDGAIRGDVEYNRVMVTSDLAVTLEVVGTHQQAVVRGDMVQAGALVMFSPIGTILPSVQSYVLRLACTNGVTSTDILREFRYGGGDGGEGDDVWQFFRVSVRDAYNSVGRIINRWREMIEERLEPADRAMILEAMIKEAGIPKEDANAIRAMALQDPPQSTYDVLNLISYASSHLLEQPHQVRRAQTALASFQVQTEHERICPVCRRRQLS